MPKRDNNNRKYPEGSSPRPDNSAAKREEAKERQAYSDSLTVEQKLAALDTIKPLSNRERCGGESKKVRAKLAALLTKKVVVAAHVATQEVSEGENTEKKHLKAKERRNKEKKDDVS